MLSLIMSLNLSGKILGAVALIGSALFMLQIPGVVNIDTIALLYENEQWEAQQKFEISPGVMDAINSNESSVAAITQQLNTLKAAKANSEINLVYSEQTRSDGWTIIEARAIGQSWNSLNSVFLDGNATISTATVEGQNAVAIRKTNIDSAAITNGGGSNSVRIGGQKILSSNADQIQLNATAIWENPIEVDVVLTEISGTPSLPEADVPDSQQATPAQGGDTPAQPAQAPDDIDIIRNGDFELQWEGQDGVAPEWEGYDNGHAHFGWYEELWAEAVYHGVRAQLMEIFETEANIYDRVMAIHQTVEVVPDSEYELTLYAIMRSDADPGFRNNNEFEMHWGIDPWGEGNYDNVEEWVLMPLTEQNRLGSTAEYPEDIPLHYEMITGTVRTNPHSDQVTLFIRGLKKFSNNVEVNFDVDDVSLVGPPPGTEIIVAEVKPIQDTPTEADTKLPTSGAVLSTGASTGMFVFGGLILLLVGATATANLLGIKFNKGK